MIIFIVREYRLILLHNLFFFSFVQGGKIIVLLAWHKAIMTREITMAIDPESEEAGKTVSWAKDNFLRKTDHVSLTTVLYLDPEFVDHGQFFVVMLIAWFQRIIHAIYYIKKRLFIGCRWEGYFRDGRKGNNKKK